MVKEVYAVYDTQTGIYDSPMVFDHAKIALASMRRSVRNLYIKKEVTYDELRDRQLCFLGYFDTLKGSFQNSVDEENFEPVRVNFSSFVADLVGDVDAEV